ncbi:MAG TPA: DUF4129 domain-containing protein [Streptosporangiaceae bacterium]|jgi:hypothetical protein
MPQGVAQIRRVAVIAALCAIAAIGLQARAALPTAARGVVGGATGQAFADITAAVTGASMVAGLVLLVLVGRYRRKRKRNQSAALPMPWWARMVTVLLSLAVIVGPIVLIVRAWNGRRPVRHVLSPPLGQPGGPLSSNTSSGWALFAGMAFTAAALIIAALWVRRQRRGRDTADYRPAEPESESKASLQDALSAGTAALRDEADPRAAIIACYAAMEGSLAGAGAVPAASDTPDEVLARAASGGLIRSAAAGELTGLFRQARYGHRDIAEGERAAAQGALTRLRADLGGAG